MSVTCWGTKLDRSSTVIAVQPLNMFLMLVTFWMSNLLMSRSVRLEHPENI